MGKKELLEKKITVLTEKLREEKPVVHEYLLENPQTLPDQSNEVEFIKALEKYEKHLEQLLHTDK
ncbi:MAG: hypothetical protein WED10_11565 [Brumimicrobium sp.]